ncbi:hypothetical protein EDB86DRAFT_3079287 [Lactarius hatsudake]|nr:hypothetical protein EDB86DRAFT_3079287 [Lactarius hatsudake]
MSAIVLHVRRRPPHPPSSSTSTVVLCVTIAVTLHMTATVALHITATVALRDIIVIDPVAVIIGVVAGVTVAADLCTAIGWRQRPRACVLHGGGGGGSMDLSSL